MYFYEFASAHPGKPFGNLAVACKDTRTGSDRRRQTFHALIVDDNVADQKLIEIYLKQAVSENADVCAVSSLNEGMDALKWFHFDVLFLDLGLPESKGPETVSRFASAFPKTPIIVVTGDDDQLLGQETIKRGAQEFLCKSNLNSAGIAAAMRHAIERHKMFCQMQMLIAENTDPILVVSFEGHVQFANRAAASLLETDVTGLVGKPFDVDLMGASRLEVELYFCGCAGKPVEINVGNVHWNGARAYLVTLRDIAEQRARERRLKTEQDLLRAGHDIKAKFLANMSHELRTPLNAIIGFSNLILSEAYGPLQSDRYRDYLNDIRDSGEGLLAMINNMLEVAHAGSARFPLKRDCCEFDNLLKDELRAIEQFCEDRRITWDWGISECPPLQSADCERLRQVVQHLIGNATKFTPAGGLIAVTLEHDDGILFLSVSDTGVGICEDQIQHVFEPFAKVQDEPYNSQTSGTGLGLPLARKLIELHDGTLTIESEIGSGTRILVTLPVNPVRVLQ